MTFDELKEMEFRLHGGLRDRVGTLIKNKNWGSNFPTLGIRFQFKVPTHQSDQSWNFNLTEVKNMRLSFS